MYFHGLLGPVLGRTMFFCEFLFLSCRIFHVLLPIFLLIFVGKKFPERSSKKIPGKIL